MVRGGFRDSFPITRTRAYFNNAASTPMCSESDAAVREYMADRLAYGAGANEKWNARCQGVRRKLARLIGAEEDSIALTSGTSHGLSLVAGGFDWQEGDEVVAVAPDFTANIYPWMHLEHRSVRVRFVERAANGRFTVEDVAAQVTPSTRMLTVTSVDFSTGFLADLAGLGEFCKDRGIVFGVDGIQSVGVIPLDVSSMHVDFLAAGAHKWLLGSRGGGFLYITKALCERVRPVLFGWNSVKDPGAFRVEHELRDDAGRFQHGAPPYLVMAAWDAGLDMLAGIGIPAIRDRVMELIDAIHEGLTGLGFRVISSMEPRERSSIICFLPSGDAGETARCLEKDGIDVSVRRGAIRVAPFFYNNHDDVDRLLAALGALRR